MNNTIKLYLFVREGILTGYTAEQDSVFRMNIRETDIYNLSDFLKTSVAQAGYASSQCALVTQDIVKTYFARKIGMHVIPPHEWLEIMSTHVKTDYVA